MQTCLALGHVDPKFAQIRVLAVGHHEMLHADEMDWAELGWGGLERNQLHLHLVRNDIEMANHALQL